MNEHNQSSNNHRICLHSDLSRNLPEVWLLDPGSNNCEIRHPKGEIKTIKHNTHLHRPKESIRDLETEYEIVTHR